MKKILLILLILSSFYVKGDIHQIQVWNGYYQFLPSNNITVQLGDTVQWVQLDPPTMTHTITSDNIPNGAIPFDQIWQAPADTFFQYIPQVEGLYEYVCTPHISFGMIGSFNVINTGTYVFEDHSKNKELLKITDLFGRETKQTNQPIFYIYDDGTVEKKLIVK